MKLSDLGTLEPVGLKLICTDESGEFTPRPAKAENLAWLSKALNLERISTSHRLYQESCLPDKDAKTLCETGQSDCERRYEHIQAFAG